MLIDETIINMKPIHNDIISCEGLSSIIMKGMSSHQPFTTLTTLSAAIMLLMVVLPTSKSPGDKILSSFKRKNSVNFLR